MNLDYEKTLKIELINEFHASIHAKLLNYVLNNNLDESDTTILQVNLLDQLTLSSQINLFKLTLKELEIHDEMLNEIFKYTEAITQTTWIKKNIQLQQPLIY